MRSRGSAAKRLVAAPAKRKRSLRTISPRYSPRRATPGKPVEASSPVGLPKPAVSSIARSPRSSSKVDYEEAKLPPSRGVTLSSPPTAQGYWSASAAPRPIRKALLPTCGISRKEPPAPSWNSGRLHRTWLLDRCSEDSTGRRSRVDSPLLPGPRAWKVGSPVTRGGSASPRSSPVGGLRSPRRCSPAVGRRPAWSRTIRPVQPPNAVRSPNSCSPAPPDDSGGGTIADRGQRRLVAADWCRPVPPVVTLVSAPEAEYRPSARDTRSSGRASARRSRADLTVSPSVQPWVASAP